MKTKFLKVLTLASVGLLLTGCLPSPKKKSSTNTNEPTSAQPSTVDPNADYYSSITDDMTGETLRQALHNIIHPQMCTTNYASVWNYLLYCDAAHPESESPKSSDDILAYYRGTVGNRSDMNKEHVWPNSHSGDLVEGDPHMIRPTLTADNSNRGNSFYVEGMNSDKDGWDPKTAGMNEDYRGDCARIIFYAAVQELSLTIIDETKSAGNDDGKMGKLSDLLKWNLNYAVQQSEKNRNDILNGKMTSHTMSFNFNRNPFIDHPEYACRIWGSTNSTTKQICGMN